MLYTIFELMLLMIAVIVVPSLLAFGILYLFNLKHVIVFDYETALKYVRGQLRGVCGPGLYWGLPGLVVYEKVEMRPQLDFLRSEQIRTNDGAVIKIGCQILYQVVDPVASKMAVRHFVSAVRLIVRNSIPDTVAAMSFDEITHGHDAFNDRMIQKTADRMKYLGGRLISVQIVEMRIIRNAIAGKKD